MLAKMKVDKVSVSFPGDLGDAIRAAADGSGQTLSAWLAEAAQAKLRSAALRAALEDYQAEHGAFTAEELARAEHEMGFVADPSSSNAA